MERLFMDQIIDIVRRLRFEQSERQIARDLRCSRKTIRRYRNVCREHGFLDPAVSLPTEGELLVALGPAVPPPLAASTVEPYRTFVEGLVNDGVEMAAIFDRLREKFSYAGSYSSVRRFVHHLRPAQARVFARVETPAGKIGQVDFGYLGMLRDSSSGNLRRAYCFVMTLGFSRHMYVEIVFNQTMPIWIGCHIRAFDWFGGVPCEIVIDNLKAAVITAKLEDAVLSKPYRRLGLGYGFLIHPCPPATPRHKGKTENSIHFVQRNFHAGQDFLDELDANRRAKDWVMGRAGERVHGTTFQAPLYLFNHEEKAALMPLPVEPLDPLLRVAQPTVHPDCSAHVDRSFYLIPFRYVGKTLEAHIHPTTISFYDGTTLVAVRQRATKRGQRIGDPGECYPEAKAAYLRRTPQVCRAEAALIGPACAQLVEELFTRAFPLDHLRAVQGVVRLTQKFGPERVEAACRRALYFNDPSYRRVKSILNAGSESEPLPGQPADAEPTKQYAYARSPEEFLGGLFDDTQMISQGADSC